MIISKDEQALKLIKDVILEVNNGDQLKGILAVIDRYDGEIGFITNTDMLIETKEILKDKMEEINEETK